MIKTAIQLKAKVRNKSNGNDKIAKTMIRLFFMERFLERVSLSKYKEQFILKGGMLTASLLGIHVRATMDIDTTVRALPLIKEDMEKIIKEICELPLDDCIMFKINCIIVKEVTGYKLLIIIDINVITIYFGSIFHIISIELTKFAQISVLCSFMFIITYQQSFK